MEKKDKKKTLTISSNLKKKIDTSSISTGGKKSFSVEKKKSFKGNKNINKTNQSLGQVNNLEGRRKNFARKRTDPILSQPNLCVWVLSKPIISQTKRYAQNCLWPGLTYNTCFLRSTGKLDYVGIFILFTKIHK